MTFTNLLFGNKRPKQQLETLDSWFTPENKNENTGETKAQEPEKNFEIHKSLRGLQKRNTSIPSMPAASTTTTDELPAITAPAPIEKETPAPNKELNLTPYQLMSDILGFESRSSQILSQMDLLDKFTASDCTMDMTMSCDGTVNAALRSADGFRRTVVCRPDGTSSQRITDNKGVEIVRFNSQGQIVKTTGEIKRQDFLSATA